MTIPSSNIIKEFPLEPCNQVSFLFLREDPRSGTGVSRGVGSFGFGPDGSLYRKTGTNNNDWTIALDVPNDGGAAPEAPQPVSVLEATVTLTDAQIRTLVSQGTQVVPAPGVGFVNIPIMAFIKSRIVAGYSGGGITAVYLAMDTEGDFDVVSGFIGNPCGGAGTQRYALLPSAGLYNPTLSQADRLTGEIRDAGSGTWENMPVEVWADGEDLTGGDPANTLTVTVIYAVVPWT